MKQMTFSFLKRSLCAIAIFLLPSLQGWEGGKLHAADGWPSQYKGVMLQAFYWDSFDQTNWTILEKQADELGQYFSLVWLPQSGNCGGTSMGYDDLYWFTNYNSSFGNEKELRSLISTLKAKGVGTIADVVINHRKTLTGKNFDFPVETYKGVTYQMGAADVVKGDGGTGAADTGEGWNGMPDLDHTSTNVQNTVKAYLDLLLNDLGYVGFRYDMVKGYRGSYTKLYNESTNPTFSVGECFDGNVATVRSWINATSKTSAAFDFPFRYTVRNALRGSADDKNPNNWNQKPNYRLLASSSLTSDANYRRYAVTFVENHDTERRSNSAQDPLKKDTLAANAYMLAMPGTPCVFLTHWIDCKQDIKAMIDVRRLMGIHNESTYSNKITNTAISSVAAYETQGTNGSLLVVVGNLKDFEPAETDWVRVLSGYHYAYYLQPSMNITWVDRASGHYEKSFPVTLTAVSDKSGAQLVYTLNGSTPSATNGTRCASGTQVTIPGEKTTTLQVGLLVGSAVSSIQKRVYEVSETKPEELTIPDFCTRSDDEVCAFFEAPLTWTNTICCWAWSDTPSDNFTYSQRKNWPGVDCTLLGTAKNGNKVWKWTWDGTKQNNSAATQPAKIIFNNSGSPQTADLPFTNGGYYTRDGLYMAVPTSIGTIDDLTIYNLQLYDISGRKLQTSNIKRQRLPKGIYICNGRKIVIR